jgi:hypothetical protein
MNPYPFLEDLGLLAAFGLALLAFAAGFGHKRAGRPVLPLVWATLALMGLAALGAAAQSVIPVGGSAPGGAQLGSAAAGLFSAVTLLAALAVASFWLGWAVAPRGAPVPEDEPPDRSRTTNRGEDPEGTP